MACVLFEDFVAFTVFDAFDASLLSLFWPCFDYVSAGVAFAAAVLLTSALTAVLTDILGAVVAFLVTLSVIEPVLLAPEETGAALTGLVEVRSVVFFSLTCSD